MFSHFSKNFDCTTSRVPIRFLLIIIFIVLGFHAINLTADIPNTFAPKDIGLRVDEGYKTLAPRNLVLYVTEQWSDADQYEGWFKGSPLTQNLLLLTFSIFGTGVLVARATALLYFFILVCVFLGSEKSKLNSTYLLIFFLILAFEPFLFFFSRVALFEIALSVFLTFSLVLVARVKPINHWSPFLVCSFCGIIAFFLIKQSAILYFFRACFVLILYGMKVGNKKFIVLPVVSVIAISFFVFATYGIWSERLRLPSFQVYFNRLLANPLVEFSPWLFGLGYFCLADTLRARGRLLLSDPYWLSLCATIVGGPLILSLFSYGPPRYYVALVPAFLLTVSFWMHNDQNKDRQIERSQSADLFSIPFDVVAIFVICWSSANLLLPWLPVSQGQDPGLSAYTAIRYLFPVSILLSFLFYFLFLSTHALWKVSMRPLIIFLMFMTIVTGLHQASEVWFNPSYTSSHLREKISKIIPKDAILMGDFAPFLTLGTEIRAIYSTKGRNEGSVVQEICPDYFLDSEKDHFTLNSYRPYATFDNQLELGQYAGHSLVLYRILYPQDICSRDVQ